MKERENGTGRQAEQGFRERGCVEWIGIAVWNISGQCVANILQCRYGYTGLQYELKSVTLDPHNYTPIDYKPTQGRPQISHQTPEASYEKTRLFPRASIPSLPSHLTPNRPLQFPRTVWLPPLSITPAQRYTICNTAPYSPPLVLLFHDCRIPRIPSSNIVARLPWPWSARCRSCR